MYLGRFPFSLILCVPPPHSTPILAPSPPSTPADSKRLKRAHPVTSRRLFCLEYIKKGAGEATFYLSGYLSSLACLSYLFITPTTLKALKELVSASVCVCVCVCVNRGACRKEEAHSIT